MDSLRVSCVKNAFQNFARNKGTEYYQRVCKTAKSLLRTFENPTQAVNHNEERESNYNLMMII